MRAGLSGALTNDKNLATRATDSYRLVIFTPNSKVNSVVAHFRARARILSACVLLGLFSHGVAGGRIRPGSEGLRQVLGDASGCTVLEFAWEPRRSWWSEWLRGRPVLFVAQPDNSPREVFRGFVRFSPEGSPLSVTAIRNISQTDLADEDHLTVGARLAAFRSRDPEGRAIVTLLDLHGGRRPANLSALEHLQVAVSDFLEFGDPTGLGRTDLVLAPSVAEIRLHRVDAELELTLDGTRVRAPFEQLLDGHSDVELGPSAQVLQRQRTAAPPLQWAADVGRSLAGPQTVASLEDWTFTLRDWFFRTRYAATHEKELQTPPPSLPRRLRPPRGQSDAGAQFPPSDVPSPWPHPHPGEGHWEPAGEALTTSPGQPPLFYKTTLYPDPARPYAEHHLVVMDMARLELGLRAGYEDPRPRTGPPGSGHIPKDPDVVSRVVATFNGAFKATHGAYGMKAEGRVLIPPVPGAATVRIDEDGRVGIGAPVPDRASPQRTLQLDDALAYRQNLDPLLLRGELLPTGRSDWGDHLVGSGIAAERSALCVTAHGHLIYGWSEEATAQSLARGLQLAGCTAAIHLDMNPGHCAFAFNRVESFDPLRADGKPLHPGMRINPNRFLRWSPKDFFYVLRRRELPATALTNGLTWRPAVGSKQTGLSAILIGQKRIANLGVEVDQVDLDRVTFHLLPREALSNAAGSIAAPEGQESDESPVGAFAWALGYATAGSRSGLSIDRETWVPMNRDFATLVLGEGEAPKVSPPGVAEEARAGTELVQLPILARDRKLTEAARRLTGRRLHGALCLDGSGHLLLGRMEHDSPAPLVLTLLELGCQTVLETDRGSRSPAVAMRPEEDQPSQVMDSGTLLVAELRPARPRAYEF